MRMEQRAVLQTGLKQLQKQILSPRIIQSIEVLQLATQDLEGLLQRELSENPALELVRPDAITPDDGMASDPRGEGSSESGDRLQQDLEFLERYNDDYRDWAPRSALSDEEDPKLEALANAPDNSKTLEEHLLSQLALVEAPPRVLKLATQIIQSLDENGFIPFDPENLVSPVASDEEREDGRRALEIVRSLEPTGVGARNSAEALLLQIDPKDMDYLLFKRVLLEHWDDLLRNKLPKIARDLSVNIDDIKFVVECLGGLNPFPGREFSSVPAQVITPDVIIEESLVHPGEYEIRMVDDYIPRVRVNDQYRRMLEDAKDKETRDFVREKVENARALIEAMQQRSSTLHRVAAVVLERQKEFMEIGVAGLRPLKMQEVADEIKVHVSTVSRAVADKYVDTPQGLFALKFFFVGGTETSDGEDTSRNAVKEQLRKIVDEEDTSRPLSDIEIAKMLTQTFGIKIARRTVAKYRDQLAIPDSRQRKAY